MYVGDTIVAPATAPGNGAIAVIRISGPSSFDILGSLWKSQNKATLEPRKLSLGTIVDPQTGTDLDRAMAVVFPKPRSQTGEDVVELQCHGGSFLVRRLTALIMRLGARMAEPGEFTRRAFLNDRIDLTEAEAIADLVDAHSENALKQAISHLTGSLAIKITEMRRKLISIRAHLEAEIDFSDEGIALPSRGEIASSIESLSNDVATLHDSYRRGQLTREGARAAILGKPNVGKSSILNLLLGTDRAIVTATPGTTRDVIEESVSVGPYALVLQDTAGIRESSDEVERIGIERTKRSVENADLILAVFDSSQELTAEDVTIADHARGRIGLALLNKNDLPPKIGAGDLKALGIE